MMDPKGAYGAALAVDSRTAAIFASSAPRVVCIPSGAAAGATGTTVAPRPVRSGVPMGAVGETISLTFGPGPRIVLVIGQSEVSVHPFSMQAS